MIRFERVFKRFAGGGQALKGISVSLAAGEMAFLTGRSGAGKSTLLKLIALLERPTQGQVVINGRNTANLSRRQIPAFRRTIGIVFQDHKLLNDRSVFENVALPLIIAGMRRKELGKRVRAALDQVGLLQVEKKKPVHLSTGEQQRVGIARAVVSKPPLLIADEPTGNLDPELSLEIMKLFCRFNEVGVTVLIASHDLSLIEHLGHRRIALKDGLVDEFAEEADHGT